MDSTQTHHKIKLVSNNKNGLLIFAVKPQFLRRMNIRGGDLVYKTENPATQELKFFFLMHDALDPQQKQGTKSKVIQKKANSFYVSIPAVWVKKYHLYKHQIVQISENWETVVISLKWDFIKKIAEMEEEEIIKLQVQYEEKILQFIEREKERATIESFARFANPSACSQQKMIIEMTIKDLQAFHKITVNRETRTMAIKTTEMKKEDHQIIKSPLPP